MSYFFIFFIVTKSLGQGDFDHLTYSCVCLSLNFKYFLGNTSKKASVFS